MIGRLKSKKDVGWIFIILLFLVFWVLATVSIDPDFGWRLRAGEIYLKSGIPSKDPFTYSMSSFAWSDHAWLVTTSMGLFYKYIGKIGLAFFSTLIVFFSLHTSLKRIDGAKILKTFYISSFFNKKYWYFGSFLFLLSISVILPFSGVRAQVVSWLMIATLLTISLKENLWLRFRKFSPLYFIVWANLHGSFAAGLLMLSFIVAMRFVRKKKIDPIDLVILIISFPAGIWREVWSSITDTSLRWEIAEWMPAFFMADFSFAAFLTVSTVLIYRSKKRFKLEEISLFFLVLSQAILSRRHIPIWTIVALPMSIKALICLYDEIKKIKLAPERFNKLIIYAYIGSFVILILQIVLISKDAISLTEGNFYPDKAVNYLQENTPKGEIFSKYGWGGYLIWKLPEKKVFIDGRMPSWRWEDAPGEESVAAYIDYKEVIKGEKEYNIIFEKYDIDTVLWPGPKKRGFIDIIADKIENILIKVGRKKESFDLTKELEIDGWKVVYKDSISKIYQKQ